MHFWQVLCFFSFWCLWNITSLTACNVDEASQLPSRSSSTKMERVTVATLTTTEESPQEVENTGVPIPGDFAICLESLEDTSDVFWCPFSGHKHAFHQKCVDQLIPNQEHLVLCPLCRQSLLHLDKPAASLRLQTDDNVSIRPNLATQILKTLRVIDGTHLEAQTCLSTLLPLWDELKAHVNTFSYRVHADHPSMPIPALDVNDFWYVGPLKKINECVRLQTNTWKHKLREGRTMLASNQLSSEVFATGKHLVIAWLDEWRGIWWQHPLARLSTVWFKEVRKSRLIFSQFAEAWLRRLHHLLRNTMMPWSERPTSQTHQVLRRTMQHVVNSMVFQVLPLSPMPIVSTNPVGL